MSHISYFDEEKDFNRLHNCTEKVEIAISRLENPHGITPQLVMMYQDYLFRQAPEIATQFIDLNKLSLMPLLVKYRVIKKTNILKLIEYAREKRKMDMLSYLMDVGNQFRTRPKAMDIAPKFNPEKSELPTVILADYSRAKTGDIVWLGRSLMPWQVLENKNGCLLLITRYAIDCLPFETFYSGMSDDYTHWAISSIRFKLNTIYLDDVLTEEERKHIVPVYIDRDDNLSFEPSGDITPDWFFFLSKNEARHYLKTEKDRLAPITRYANRSMLWTLFDQYAHWWLRSQGVLTMDKYYVRDGVILSENSTVSGGRFEHFGIRPAMYYKY
ncbi:MAG: hypothetical protein IKJ05_07740 [Oscillospiraceae bacterium]|nr:hypothetical protein [Oscillospiraceae bacterium]